MLPQRYHQPYWAGRIDELGIGVALPQGMSSADALVTALDRALDTGATARAGAEKVRTENAPVVAERVVA